MPSFISLSGPLQILHCFSEKGGVGIFTSSFRKYVFRDLQLNDEYSDVSDTSHYEDQDVGGG
jgi:hypothetical protein